MKVRDYLGLRIFVVCLRVVAGLCLVFAVLAAIFQVTNSSFASGWGVVFSLSVSCSVLQMLSEVLSLFINLGIDGSRTAEATEKMQIAVEGYLRKKALLEFQELNK